MLNNLVINKEFLTKKSGKKGNLKKRIIIGSSFGLDQLLFFKDQIKCGIMTEIPHFFITLTGEIYQLVDLKDKTNFTKNKMDIDSLSIMLENVGNLKFDAVENVYYDSFGTIYNELDKIVEIPWREYIFWGSYEGIQLDSLEKLCLYLCELNKIKPLVVDSNIKTKEIINNKTIICRSNISKFYLDPNPTFNLNKLKEISNGL